MNWIDTQLLTYRAVEGHPAKAPVESELAAADWGSSVLVLLELFHVLTRDYRVPRGDARAEVDLLARAPISWSGLQVRQAAEVVALADREGVASTDAALLSLAEKDRGVLVTQDLRLLRAAEARGIAARNPISRGLAAEIAAWEQANLAEKGLRRLLRGVHEWLESQDAGIAERFRQVTVNLSQPPALGGPGVGGSRVHETPGQ